MNLENKEKLRRMNACLEGLEQGLKRCEIAKQLGVSNQSVTVLFQEMEKIEEFRERIEKVRIRKKVESYVARQKKRYIKNLQIYFQLLPLYTYLKENHATWQMAEEHFQVGHGKIQYDIRKLKSISPAAGIVLEQIANENIHNTHRIQNRPVEGLPNEMNWLERSILHIDYIMEHQCSIQEARNYLGASVQQIGNDIYRMFFHPDEEIRKKAFDAYTIVADYIKGGCSYVDYKGKINRKNK